MLVDAGEVGSATNPGHAHADTLSFELSAWGRRVIVDAGTFDYEPSETRRYTRSTAAHKTVEVDGQDSSEVWGVFRVGRVASPRDVRRGEERGWPFITAAHDGYRHLAGAPLHRRTLRAEARDAWSVSDVVEGSGRHSAIGRIRFHPDFEIHLDAEGCAVATCAEGVVRVRPDPATRFALDDAWWFPSFGVRRRCRLITMGAEGPLPLRFGYRLELSKTG
jgi:uncharacterized heparinase superfamily protein